MTHSIASTTCVALNRNFNFGLPQCSELPSKARWLEKRNRA
jgi:hypothetical protein